MLINQIKIELDPAALLTAEDEVRIEDAQCSLVGALLIVNCGRDDKSERDACDALQHDQDYHQHQGAFIRYLQRERENRQ